MRGFKEINPCLIHKYQRQPCALLYFLFYFFGVCYSISVAVMLIQTHLTTTKFSCLFITLLSDSPVMDVESIPSRGGAVYPRLICCIKIISPLRRCSRESIRKYLKSAHFLCVLAFGRLEALFKYCPSPWSLSSVVLLFMSSCAAQCGHFRFRSHLSPFLPLFLSLSFIATCSS